MTSYQLIPVRSGVLGTKYMAPLKRERKRERERENSKSKILFSKDCSLGSFRPV